jgi:hypothetical protein
VSRCTPRELCLPEFLAFSARYWRDGFMRFILPVLCLALTACASAPRHVVAPSEVSFTTHAPADGQLVGRIAVPVEDLGFESMLKAPRALQEQAAGKGGNVIVLDKDAENIIKDIYSLTGDKKIWCKVYYSQSH